MAEALGKVAKPAADQAGTRVKWNVEHMKSSYVNFANANSTREEVTPETSRTGRIFVLLY